MFKTQFNKNRLFTMIELLVVIGIIGILAALILGNMGGGVLASNKTKAKAGMATVIAAYINADSTGKSPSSYYDTTIVDPWGVAYGTPTYNSNFERWELSIDLGGGTHQSKDDNLPDITLFSWKASEKN